MKIIRKTIIFLFSISIFIIMSAAVLPASNSYERLFGQDRYETAIAVSQAGWETAQNAVLAYGGDFPDALSATPLAAILDAPILLTGKNKLNSRAEAEMERLQVKNVYIVGGVGVIPQTIEDLLSSKGYNCKRIAGRNRYETSVRIAEFIQNHVQSSGKVFVVNGQDYPDALSVSPFAAQLAAPILLTSPKSSAYDHFLESFVRENYPINAAFLVGDDSLIRDAVADLFPAKERITGKDRYERNVAVIEKFADSLNFGKVYIATGDSFPDALAGSVLASLDSAPIILTGKTLSAATSSLLKSRVTPGTKLIVLGGPGALPDSVIERMINTIEGKPVQTIYFVDQFAEVKQGEKFVLPVTVRAVTEAGSSLQKEFEVNWNPEAADTSSPGEYIFEGTVEGYGQKVYLYLEVIEDQTEHDQDGIKKSTPTLQQIKDKWEQYKPTFSGYPYVEDPSIVSPYSPGKLKSGVIDDGVKMANFVRFLAGMPDDLIADPALNNQAQHGAVLIASIEELTHTPSKPANMSQEFYRTAYKCTTSSNIHYRSRYYEEEKPINIDAENGFGLSLANSVRSLMGDAYSMSNVGHRRWILNPDLQKIGFGLASRARFEDGWYKIFTYDAMQVFDRSRKEEVDYDYIAWPSDNYFPADFMNKDDAWSISLNPKKYLEPKLTDVRVTLTRLSDNKVWSFDQTDNDLDAFFSYGHEYFNVDTEKTGVANAIIFLPDQTDTYKDGDLYNVRISGIKNINGKSVELNYKVNFIDI